MKRIALASLLFALAGCASWYPGQRPGPYTCTDTAAARTACQASPGGGFDCWDRCDPEGHSWHVAERPAGAVEGR